MQKERLNAKNEAETPKDTKNNPDVQKIHRSPPLTRRSNFGIAHFNQNCYDWVFTTMVDLLATSF